MKRLIINLAVFVLTLAIGATLHALRPTNKRVSRPARETESYGVYSAVIKEFHHGDGNLVLIYDVTSVGPPYKEEAAEFKIVRKNFPKVKMPEILRDYSSENVTHQALTPRFALASHYALVTDSENYFANVGSFHSRYLNSRGIIGLSAIGFNARMDQALLYARELCAGECGGGFYLLTKEDGVWTIAEWQLG